MNPSINTGTTLLEAFEIDLLNPTWVKDVEFQKLSIGQKLIQIIKRLAVKAFAFILNVKLTSDTGMGAKYDSFAQQHDAKWVNNKPVILVLHIKNAIPIDPQHFLKLEKESGYEVVFQEINEIKDANEAMERLKWKGCTIQALWIRAHGTPTTITFKIDHFYINALDIGNTSFSITHEKNIKDACDFCDTVDKHLEKEAPIILESCYTGMPMPQGEENIATFISRQAKRKTFAPAREALNINDGVSYSKEKGFNVSITSNTSDKNFAKGSFLGKLSAVWLAFRDQKEDITKIFEPL